MILLDTHALIWVGEANRRLGPDASRAVERARRDDELAVSAITFWEVALLAKYRRLALGTSPAAFRAQALAQGIREIALDGLVAVTSVELSGLPGDPADRFIAATAMTLDAALLTADERLLTWPGGLKTHDARR